MTDKINLDHMTPVELAQIPAGIPPPGVVPNLIDPPTVGFRIIAAGSILMAIMLIVVAMRFYVVLRIKKKMGADDWTIVVGVIGSCFYFIVLCLAVTKAKFGTHMYNLSVAHMKTKDVALLGFISNGPPHLIWPCIKTTFFIMYLKLFGPLIWLRRCVYFGLAAVWTWYVSMAIAQLVITSPPPGSGWIASFGTPRYLQTFKLCVPTASFSLASDVYILSLPLIAISHLQLNTAKKIGVAAMFSTGVICCVASSLSVYFQHRIYADQSDYTYHVVYVYLVYTLEMTVGISTSCMPALARLHRDKKGVKLNSILSSLRLPLFNSSKSSKSSSHPRPTGPSLENYPRKRPYAHIMDDSLLRSEAREMDHVDSEQLEFPLKEQTPGVTFPSDRIHYSV